MKHNRPNNRDKGRRVRAWLIIFGVALAGCASVEADSEKNATNEASIISSGYPNDWSAAVVRAMEVPAEKIIKSKIITLAENGCERVRLGNGTQMLTLFLSSSTTLKHADRFSLDGMIYEAPLIGGSSIPLQCIHSVFREFENLEENSCSVYVEPPTIQQSRIIECGERSEVMVESMLSSNTSLESREEAECYLKAYEAKTEISCDTAETTKIFNSSYHN